MKTIRDDLGIRQLPPANSVKIKYGAGSVELEANGEIAALEINYMGVFNGVNRLGAGWVMKANKNKVIIYSLLETPITDLLFDYIGELKITSARYVTWEKELKYAIVENLMRNSWRTALGEWGSDARKYEEIETQTIIHKKVLKTRI